MLSLVLAELAGSLLELDELPVPPAVPLPEPVFADEGLEEEPMPELALPLLLVVEPGVVLELDGLDEEVPDVPVRSPLHPATTSSAAAIIA